MSEPRSPAVRVLGSEGFAAVVRHSRPETLDWLEEFFAPWLVATTAPAAPDAPRVTVDVDVARFAEAIRDARPLREHVPCFTLDGGDGALPLLRSRAGRLLALDRTHGFLLAVHREGDRPAEIHVLAEREIPAARLALVRVLRELGCARAAREGALLLHAGAVAGPEGITAFVGEKRSGKSTLLVHALQGGGARFVANDRLAVRVRPDEVSAVGVPTIVSLRAGTLGLSERLRSRLAGPAWHWTSTLAQARADQQAGRAAPGHRPGAPARVTAAQLCALLGTAAQRGGPLRRIVFPEIVSDDAVPRFRLDRLPVDEAARRLGESGLFAGGHAASFLDGAAAIAAPRREAALRSVAQRVPCLSCALGPDAYRSPSVWEALRDAGA